MLSHHFEETNIIGSPQVYAYYSDPLPLHGMNFPGTSELIQIHCDTPALRFVTEDEITIIRDLLQTRLYLWDRESNTFLLFFQNKMEALTDDPVFIIRGLLTDKLPNGWIKLHAGCLSLNGTGFLLAGQKRKGKTTTVVRLLELDEEIVFIADDKIYYNSTSQAAFGSPQPIRLRKEALYESTLFNSEQLKGTWISDKHDTKFHVTMAELSGTLGREIKPYSNLKFGILVDLNNDGQEEQITLFEEHEKFDSASILNEFPDAIHPHWCTTRRNGSVYFLNDMPWYRFSGNYRRLEHFKSLLEFIRKQTKHD